MEKQATKLYLFYCSSSVDSSGLIDNGSAMDGEELKMISLPCSGKVNLLYLLKAFETGADGVVIVTCGKGICQNLEGNLRAQKRAAAVDSLLKEIGLGNGLIEVIPLTDEGEDRVICQIEQFREKIRNISTAKCVTPTG